jgi:outer membrane lipoprotein-sorting protein
VAVVLSASGETPKSYLRGRRTMLIELAFVFLLHADVKNEAERLFRKMEMTLKSAKSVECSFEAKGEGGKAADGSAKGSLTLGEGNKSRLEMTLKKGAEVEKIALICDGEKMMSPDDKTRKVPAPKWLNDLYRAALVRSGPSLRLSRIDNGANEQPQELKVDDVLKVSNFKLGKKEKIDDKEAQAIHYNLGFEEFKDPLTVTLWIDTKTNLPIKRELIGKEGDDKVILTETYSKFSIDEKIDPKKFELPKD